MHLQSSIYIETFEYWMFCVLGNTKKELNFNMPFKKIYIMVYMSVFVLACVFMFGGQFGAVCSSMCIGGFI